MQMFAIVVSLAFSVVAVFMTARAVQAMLGVIRVGQAAEGRTDHPARRAVNMLKETVLHTRMLQWTWVGILHWFAFAAFLFLSTAVGSAFFQLFDPEWAIPLIGHWIVYEWLAELLGLLGTAAIIPLIVYRLTHTPGKLGRRSRFFGSTMWQAYFVEAMVLLESVAILFIRGAEWKLFGHEAGRIHFPISAGLGEALYPDGAGALKNIIFLVAMIKIVSAMIWLMVISANLTMGVAWHRFTAWFNIFFKRESSGGTALGAMKPLTSAGKPVNFEDLEEMDEDTKLGVGAIEDFSWKGILDFTTCTECGRCQSQCPAWNTEKPLSPKLMMMGLREHAYAKAPYLRAGSEEERTNLPAETLAAASRDLIGKAGPDEWFYNPEGGDFVIDEDALWSCTNCGACVQQCPVDIEHVDHIMDMRRYQVLVESNFPAELNGLFKGLENKGNPWNMNPKGRLEWAEGLDFEVPVLGDAAENMDDFDWLFWVGCAGAYEDRAKKTTRAVAELLHMADVKFAVLGNGETCTGDPARRAGNEFVFQGLASQNVETFKERRVKKVVSTCAHCFNTLKNEYKEFGIELEVVHHTQLLNRLVREKRLTPVAGQGATRSITYHDPCFLGRHNQVYSPPRELLQVIPNAELKEMPRNSEKSFCCGAGGARMWMEETIGERINVNRTKEAVATGADQIAVACPFCRVMLSDGLTAQQSKGEAREEVEVLDVAQLLLASVKGEGYQPKKTTGDVATKAEPAAGDVTQTKDTLTRTEEVGAGAAASGSLFDDAPAGGKGGSLFDDAPSGGTGGSLFHTPADADQPAPGSSTGTQPEASPSEASQPEDGEKKTGSLFDEGSSLFDTPAEPEETSAPPTSAPEATPSTEPAVEPDAGIGSGSLFDIAAPAPARTSAAPASPPEPEPGAPEAAATSDAGSDETATPVPAPKPEKTPEPAAEPTAEIGSGSLFDIAAPTPAQTSAAPASTPEPEPAAPEPAAPEPAAEEPAAPAATDPAPAAEAGSDDSDDSGDEESEEEDEGQQEPAKPDPSQAHQPATDKDIGSAGSLFDL